MVYPNKEFLYASPESQGIRGEEIDSMLEDIRLSGKDIHSILILKNGYLVSETYFAPYTAQTKHSMYSCSKTFTSMLIGIAQGKGLLSTEDKVVSFFPDKVPEEPCANLLDMRIKDLLSMSTGNDQDTFRYMMQSDDMVKTFLSRPVEHEPGTFFRYNTGATYMLSAILTKLTGKSALQLANEWFLNRIGIEGALWDADRNGISLGGTGLHLTPRDMARFGLLLLNRGNWEGEQLIPEEYVQEASRKHIDTTNHIDHPDWLAGYCWQMWRCSFNNAYRADGMGGQFIVVMPDDNAVVVFTSSLGSDIVYPLDITNKYLSGAFTDKVRPEREKKAAAHEPAQLNGSVIPFGKRIKLADKIVGMVYAITLNPNSVYVETDQGDELFTVGLEKPVLSYDTVYLPGMRSGARLSFMYTAREKGLELRMNVLGEPYTLFIDMDFEGETADIDIKATGFGKFERTTGTFRR